MRKYQKEVIEQSVVSQWFCDACKRDFLTDEIEAQEAVHFYNECGYGSVFGDGATVCIDLCQHCVKRLLGEYLTIE